MKRILVSVAAALIAGAASAQTSTTVTTTGPAASGVVTVTPEVRTKVKQYVVKEKRATVAAPSGVTITTGSVLPPSIELHTFPADVGVTQYRYTVVGDRTVLVDPGSRRIIEVIE
jgi:hypothetical protein